MQTSSIGHLVVVGASVAGVRAVEGVRRAGFEGRVTLVERDSGFPYDRPPLSKGFLERTWSSAGDGRPALPFDPTSLNVDYRSGAPVDELDTNSCSILVGGVRLAYDALVVATGAAARTLPGQEELGGVLSLRSLRDAENVRNAMDAGARVVVIGGGFIGAEIASAARKRDLVATIIEAEGCLLSRSVGPEIGRHLRSLHEDNGTEVRCGVSVESLLGRQQVEAVRLSDGTEIPADLVVVGIGTVPETEWLAGAVAEDSGILCDSYLRTTEAQVYAAGDVVRWQDPDTRVNRRLEHWTAAAEQGTRAGLNAVFPDRAEPFRTVPYFWSDWYGHRLQGLGERTEAAPIWAIAGPGDPRYVALYGGGGKIRGAFALNGQRFIMKFRPLIERGASLDEAMDLASRLGAPSAS